LRPKRECAAAAVVIRGREARCNSPSKFTLLGDVDSGDNSCCWKAFAAGRETTEKAVDAASITWGKDIDGNGLIAIFGGLVVRYVIKMLWTTTATTPCVS